MSSTGARDTGEQNLLDEAQVGVWALTSKKESDK